MNVLEEYRERIRYEDLILFWLDRVNKAFTSMNLSRPGDLEIYVLRCVESVRALYMGLPPSLKEQVRNTLGEDPNELLNYNFRISWNEYSNIMYPDIELISNYLMDREETMETEEEEGEQEERHESPSYSPYRHHLLIDYTVEEEQGETLNREEEINDQPRHKAVLLDNTRKVYEAIITVLDRNGLLFKRKVHYMGVIE